MGAVSASAPTEQTATAELIFEKEEENRRASVRVERLPSLDTDLREQFETPRPKRKARVSPGVLSSNEAEFEQLTLRKRKEKLKKVCLNPGTSVDLTGDTSAAESMDDPEQITGRNLRGRKGARRSRRTGKTEDSMEAGTSSGRMVSDEEMGSLLQETRKRRR